MENITNLLSAEFAQDVVEVNITKTRLFKYLENFTTEQETFSDKKKI